MSSHVKCKGRYDGCLGTAHRGAVLDLCTNCRLKRQEEMQSKGLDFHGRHRMPGKKIDAVLDELVPRGTDLLEGLDVTRAVIRRENVIADAETAGHGVMTPTERFDYAVSTARLTGKENAMAYMEMYRGAPAGTILVGDAEHVPYAQRVEIREMARADVATHEEIAEHYALTPECLEKILAEPDAQPKEEEPKMPARRGVSTPEHMEKMRLARAAKREAERAELERLREAAAVTNGATYQALSTDPIWLVTIVTTRTVEVQAPNFAQAGGTAQKDYGISADQIAGIVRK